MYYPVLQVLQSHYSYMTSSLPSSHRVIVAPLMPLNILSEECSHHCQLLSLSNTLPDSAVDKNKYRALYRDILTLHLSSTELSNVQSLSQLQYGFIRVLKGSSPSSVLTSPWHSAMSSFILSALHGMKTKYLKPIDTNPLKDDPISLSLEPVFSEAQLITPPDVDVQFLFGPGVPWQSTIKRTLGFDKSDLQFLLAEAKELTSDTRKLWYFGASLPALLFSDQVPYQFCVDSNCEKPITHLVRNDSRTVASVLEAVWTFLTDCQCLLPRGNSVSLLPLYPCMFAPLPDGVDGVTHTAMHLIRDSEPLFFSQDERTSADLQLLVAGWNGLLLKTRKHHTLSLFVTSTLALCY